MRKPNGRMMRAVITAGILAAGAVANGQQPSAPAESTMGAALHAEEIEGNLEAALAGYERVIRDAAASRQIVATALLHIGQVYEKLGNTQARTSYERIGREFADQVPVARQAQARLVAMSESRTALPATMPADDRVMKRGSNITFGDGRVSPDGRYISYTEWSLTGNLMLHDLSTGADRALTGNKDFTVGNASTSVFSPDGKQVAYGWRAYRATASAEPIGANASPANENDLRIISITEGLAPQPRRVCVDDDVSYFNPLDWTRDGLALAVTIERRDRTSQLAVVSVASCSVRVLKTVGWRRPSRMFFSPDGKFIAYDLPASDLDAQSDIYVIAVDASRESAAVHHPAHDQVIGWSNDGSYLLYTSDRTGSVGLWRLPMLDGRAAGAPALVRPNIGTVISQGFTSTGALFTVKDASTLSLQVAPIDLASGRLTGSAVLQSFQSNRPDWSPDGRRLAYSARGANSLPIIAVHSTDTGERRELKPPLLYIPEPRWLPDGRTLVTAGRDFKGRGVLYRIDVESGESTLVAEATATNRVQVDPDGLHVYFQSSSGPVRRHLTTGATTPSPRMPSGSGSRELSPDGHWFAFVTNDQARHTSTLRVMSISEAESRDLMTVSAPDQLWAYGSIAWLPDSSAVLVMKAGADLADAKELWLVPTRGAAPRKLDVDVRAWRSDGIRLHPRGTRIAFFTGEDSREVWRIESVLPTPGKP